MSNDRGISTVLLTGSVGFIGSRFSKVAAERGLTLRNALRRPGKIEGALVGNISPYTDWRPALDGVSIVVHLAARVHLMNDSVKDPLNAYRWVNTAGTINLARQAAGAGVRRFVYISSVKVYGESTSPDRPFSVKDPTNPQDPYALSKLEAENELLKLAAETGMEVVIIRPPLVYGPGVKANFLRLMKVIYMGLPLPLALVNNKRSMVALDNLVDLIITCAHHPAAAGQTFLVSDGQDFSTPELIKKLARAMRRQARLFPVPTTLLQLGGRICGKQKELERLMGSLQVDIKYTCDTLEWRPPISAEKALVLTARNFLSMNRRF